MKTLQEHYNAIKSGKGNKAQFLKQAKHLFPQYINQYSDFDTATHVLKSKQIISEAAGGVVSKGFDIFDWKKILTEIKTEDLNSNTLYQYDGLFTLGANEGKKVKGTCKYIENIGTDNSRFRFKWVKVDSTNADYAITDGSSFFTNKDGLKYITPIKSLNESVKAEEKETSKEVKDYDKHNFDNKDMKNADNINFNEIMKGFYAELRDEKNNGKTGDEIKAMVVKNLAKDPLYYTKNGEFGVKDLGYTDEAPGLGKPKEAKGKYKSSGYGDLDTEGKVEKSKANVQDSLGDREAKTAMPRKVKEMSVTPQNSKGVKKMPMPGKEKKIKLKEGIGMFHDPIGYKKSEPSDLDKIFTKKYKGNGMYVIYKNGEEVKTIEGEGNANAWINNEMRKLKEGLSPEQFAQYSDYSDQEIIQWAEEDGMEDFVVLDGEGGLANREEVLAVLLGKEVDNDIDRDEEDMWGPDDIDPAGGRGPSSHLEESSIEFKEGDKVKDTFSKKSGVILNKTMNPGGGLFYKVKFDNGKEEVIRATELEKIAESKLRSIIKSIIREELKK
jgi:hypothetical protein